MPRDTAGPISKRPGGPTVMVETSPRNTTDEIGTSCRLRTERESFRTDRKTPTCATAMRVWTLGRIETLRPRARSHLTRGALLQPPPVPCNHWSNLSKADLRGAKLSEANPRSGADLSE